MAKANMGISASVALKRAGITAKVKITNMREYRARIWIAAQLIRLGFWVISGKTEIEEEEVD